MSSPTILALGDSLTAGYGLAASQAFPAQLERALRRSWPRARVINAGVSGDTSASGLARLPRVLSGLSARPDLALVTLGANDLLRGIDPGRTRANLDMIVHLLDAAGVPSFLIALVAPRAVGALADAFNAVHAAVAASHGAPMFAVSLSGIVGNPRLTLADRLHPNGEAIGMVVTDVLPRVEEALRQAVERETRGESDASDARSGCERDCA